MKPIGMQGCISRLHTPSTLILVLYVSGSPQSGPTLSPDVQRLPVHLVAAVSLLAGRVPPRAIVAFDDVTRHRWVSSGS